MLISLCFYTSVATLISPMREIWNIGVKSLLGDRQSADRIA